MEKLCQLPIAALDLAAFGGTNFAHIEIERNTKAFKSDYLRHLGHTAPEMIEWLNTLSANGQTVPEVIVSGGIKNPVQAHSYRQKLQSNSIVGLGAVVLEFAMGDYSDLQKFLTDFLRDFELVKNYFFLKERK